MSKIKVTGNEKVQIIFCLYLRQKWTGRLTSNQNQHFTHIVKYISPAKMIRFVIFVWLPVCHIPFVHCWNLVES